MKGQVSNVFFFNWRQMDDIMGKKTTFIYVVMTWIVTHFCEIWCRSCGFKIYPPAVDPFFFPYPSSFLSVFFFLSHSPSSSWAQLSTVTRCHSFISSLHHSFCPSEDLGIHLSVHLSASFSLTSGNEEETGREGEGEEGRDGVDMTEGLRRRTTNRQRWMTKVF